MRFFSSSITLAALAAIAIAAVAPLRAIEKYEGETTGRHIVILKDGASKNTVFSQARRSGAIITHEWDIIHGFAGHFNEATLNELHSNPDVESVSEDGIMHIFGTQTDAPWGLERISSTSVLSHPDVSTLDHVYNYSDESLGSGVDVYVVDTGVRTTHVTFGGRAKWGASFGNFTSADGNGHGTHCAGTIAGSQYGVAKKASIVAVKVLDDEGDGTIADIVSGLGWVKTRAASSGRPSIVSLSLGGRASSPLDQAVTSLTGAGVHVAVAAGNSAIDAKNTSPARVPSVVTVGASNIGDTRAYFSNYGKVVDIFAPGEDVISAWGSSDTATNSISGTSMATPHVAGLIAYLISKEGNASPAAIENRLQELALKDVLSDIPSGTVNYLAHNI